MKTIEQIKETWEKVISAGINIELYLGFGNSESRKYFRANLVDSAAELIADDFLDSINQYFSKNLSVIPPSQIDERTDTLIYYDLEKSPVSRIISFFKGSNCASELIKKFFLVPFTNEMV